MFAKKTRPLCVDLTEICQVEVELSYGWFGVLTIFQTLGIKMSHSYGQNDILPRL